MKDQPNTTKQEKKPTLKTPEEHWNAVIAPALAEFKSAAKVLGSASTVNPGSAQLKGAEKKCQTAEQNLKNLWIQQFAVAAQE